MKTQLLSAIMSNVPVTLSAGNNSLSYENGTVTAKAVGKSAVTTAPDVAEGLLVAEQLPMVFMALRGKRSLPHGWRSAA